jgi:Tol biopolymer transport system component
MRSCSRRLVLVVAPLVVSLGLAPMAKAVFPGANGKIALVTSDSTADDSYGTVWLVAEGVRPKSLGDGWQASFSPSGRRVAYRGTGPWGICVVHEDGSHRRCRGGFNVGSPRWSPSGRGLAFIRNDFYGNFEGVLVRAADGSRERLVVADPAAEVSWSPSGRLLAFSTWSGDQWAIKTVRSSGADVRELGRGDQPSWSARGWLAFRRDRTLVVNPPGQEERVLLDGLGRRLAAPTDFETGDPWPADYSWSPHGLRLAVASRGRIWVVSADGGERRALTARVGARAPQWSPDGTRIAYVQDRYRFFPSDPDLFVVPARGGPTRHFTRFHLDPDCTDDCDYEGVATIDWQSRHERPRHDG